MGSLRGLYNFLKTCSEPIWILRGLGKIICIWSNSHTIIVIRLAYRWHHLRPYMDESLDHWCDDIGEQKLLEPELITQTVDK